MNFARNKFVPRQESDEMKEKTKLDEKLATMLKQISSFEFIFKTEEKEKELILSQFNYMLKYSLVLGERIKFNC